MDRVELYSGGFPVTTTTFNFLQDAYGKAIKALTALGGDTFILEGVQVVAGNVTEGSIVYNGELLPFRGGTFNNTVSIYEDVQEVAYNQDNDNDGNLDQKRAYVSRYAKCGTGGLESFNFNLLKRFTPLTQMSMPIGLISMWSGAIANIPQGWVLCNGTNGTPNLRGRFVVGLDPTNTEYNAVGKKGGSNNITPSGTINNKSISLTVSRDGWGKTGSSLGSSTSGRLLVGSGRGEIAENLESINAAGSNKIVTNSHNHVFTGSPKDNRPPYYALAYIMFKGL